MKSILVATEKKIAYEPIRNCFRSEYKIDVVGSREKCFESFKKRRYELVFIDIELLKRQDNGNSGTNHYKAVLQPFWKVFPTSDIVVMSSQEKIREAVMAVKAGASDYITYPIHIDELLHVAENIYESTLMHSELHYLRSKICQKDIIELTTTGNLKMTRVFDRIRSLAPTNTTVLLTG